MYFLLAIGLVQTCFLDGLVVSYRIAGGSMAGAILGRHRNVVCADCGYTFACDAETLPVAPRAVCPNCGYADNDLESLPDMPGDRVLMDRAALALRPPRRWEIVAFRSPRPADAILVKRVVGLPGESIAIRSGDVYVNGRIQRKSLAQQCAAAILVHDANFEPTREPKPPPRWRSEGADTRWSSSGGHFVHAAGSEKEPIDWLGYHHWQRLMGTAGEVRESPITDLYSYNPSQPRREEDVHAVADVMLSFRLAEVTGRGLLAVRASDGREPFEARLQFDENPPRYQILHGDRRLPDMVGGIPGRRNSWLVEVSLIDQQFLLAIDGKTLAVWPFERSQPASPPSSPLAIGMQGLGATIADLRVYRDVYYTEPVGRETGPAGNRSSCLSAGQYFVLGDNSPISEDSRAWPEGGAVEAKLLVGKPLVAIPSLLLSPWRGWDFQVPNPVQIRYIR